jgi:DNA-binding transcriptional MocR family regulator
VLYLSSLSKTVAPALRIGWLVGPAPVLQRAAIAKQTMDLCTSPLAQLAAAHYLASGRYPAAVAAACTRYAERMAAMHDTIVATLGDRLRLVPARGGLFLWATWDGPVAPQALFEAAVEEGVLFVPGAAFHPEGGTVQALRLSFAAPEVPQIHQGVQRLARAFDRVARAAPSPSSSLLKAIA